MGPASVDMGVAEPRQLDELLIEGYGRAYRTAYLILRDPSAAEDAVQEAFLRVWRFRDAIPAGTGRTAWLYRVVVNACVSRIRSESARTGRDDGDAALAGLADRTPEPEVQAERSHLAGGSLAVLVALAGRDVAALRLGRADDTGDRAADVAVLHNE